MVLKEFKKEEKIDYHEIKEGLAGIY